MNTKEIILICAKLALSTLAVPSPDTTNDFGTGAKAQQQAIVRRLTEIANDASKIKRFFGA